MNELFCALSERALVLDLGSGRGSFSSSCSCTLVRVDVQRAAIPDSNFTQADAARLPFPDRCFDLVISNHSLEHFASLAEALSEIGRVIKPEGALYVAVPDATTVTDRLYRWLARGGGHVNAFSSAEELARKITFATGLKHVATRTLSTGLSFLNRKNRRSRLPRRLLLLGGGTQVSVRVLTYLVRLLDRFLGIRTSVYGWALYFGNVAAPVDCNVWSNVCIRCGAGHPSEWLRTQGRVLGRLAILPMYRCPNCQTVNMFTNDKHYRRLNEPSRATAAVTATRDASAVEPQHDRPSTATSHSPDG